MDRTFTSRFFEYNNNDQNPLIRKVFGSYEDFETEFKIVFGKVDEKKAAEKQLAKLKQTGSVSHYAV